MKSTPDIRRRVAGIKEHKRQVEGIRHPLFNHVPSAYRFASRERFLKSVEPFPLPTSESMSVILWKQKVSDLSPVSPMARHSIPVKSF